MPFIVDMAPDVLASGAVVDAPASEAAGVEHATLLIDPWLVEQLRRIQEGSGKDDMLSRFIRRLEGDLASFAPTFSELVERGETAKAVRAAHSVKGMCQQLGARALGLLFADIERSAKRGDYAEARRKFDAGASLIARSLEALKRA